MFKHSIKVPRLYKVAAKIAKEVKEGVGSIKHLVYANQKKHPNIKAIYALVTTLFQKSNDIENMLKRCQLLIKEPRLDPWLTKILIVELLWGKKYLPGDSKPEKTVRAYEQIFKAHLSDVSLSAKSNNDRAEIKPRYVRVNTLHMELHEAVNGFRDENWRLCKFLDKTNYKEFLTRISSLEPDEFLVDIHVPNLLIFPPKTQFYSHPAYKNGSIILQDKASCLPVHILNPSPGSVVLDMCAAPGMKTTQIAAVMNDQGIVYAVEKNPFRFETLNKIVKSSGAGCIKILNKDVLTCQTSDFPGLQYILVDPSCTGSGMTDRLESEEKDNQERIRKLSGFQIKILRSALTKFPDVKRVVYSTCSIYPEENEDVVRQVLETNTMFKLVPAAQFVNNTWQNFGSSEFGDIGKYCLYAKPAEDFTNGFFVAVFERLENGEENKMFNAKVYNYKKHVQSQERRKSKRQQTDEYNDFDNDTKIDQQNSQTVLATPVANTTENEHVATTATANEINANMTLKRKKKKYKKNELKDDCNTIVIENDISNAMTFAKQKRSKLHRRKEEINICKNEEAEKVEIIPHDKASLIVGIYKENAQGEDIKDKTSFKDKKKKKSKYKDYEKKSLVTHDEAENILIQNCDSSSGSENRNKHNESVDKETATTKIKNNSIFCKKIKKNNSVLVNEYIYLENDDIMIGEHLEHQDEPIKEKKKKQRKVKELLDQCTIDIIESDNKIKEKKKSYANNDLQLNNTDSSTEIGSNHKKQKISLVTARENRDKSLSKKKKKKSRKN